ncbi:unnamed protein product, partial [marine sediment metagenome]
SFLFDRLAVLCCDSLLPWTLPYEAYFAGKLKDYAYPQEKIEEALKELPKV